MDIETLKRNNRDLHNQIHMLETVLKSLSIPLSNQFTICETAANTLYGFKNKVKNLQLKLIEEYNKPTGEYYKPTGEDNKPTGEYNKPTRESITIIEGEFDKEIELSFKEVFGEGMKAGIRFMEEGVQHLGPSEAIDIAWENYKRYKVIENEQR